MKRPGGSGKKGREKFIRMIMVLYAYERAKRAGEKHTGAIDEAVKYVRGIRPVMPISAGGVKRILAEWRSNRRSLVFCVTEPEPANSIITLPNGRVFRQVWTVGLSVRASYPRANAALKQKAQLRSL